MKGEPKMITYSIPGYKTLLGIAVILGEGDASTTLEHADVVCVGIVPALELLMNPLRLIATLRA